MNTKDINLLEFDKVREIIAGYCTCDSSRELAKLLAPRSDLKWITERLNESSEARYILEHETGISADGLLDVSDMTVKASHGITLDPESLNMIRQTLDAVHNIKQKITPYRTDCPLLGELAHRLGDFKSLESQIKHAIAPDGTLQPHASQKLMDIRNQQRSKRTEIFDKLQGIISDESQKKYIQDPIVTEREGRYVIAVKYESQGNIRGIVHDISNTGQTVFMEPWQTLSLGNSIKELEIEEAREIERIMQELSEAVGKVASSINSSITLASLLDLALAKARFAHRFHAYEAECYHPKTTDAPYIHLTGARHPLLGEKAKPLDIDLGKDYTILVITGPNTGGKTVALKTLGLMCMMTQSGLPIPADEGAMIPIFKGIYADIGDEQSIDSALSTFSGHMSNIARIMQSIDNRSLVLLDELGAATDPTEGAALAKAILNHLMKNGTLAVITTHYSEVKVLAHTTEGMQNASFNFDPETMLPTYQLTLGTPGGSNAIATARTYGLPRPVIDDAMSMLSGDAVKMDQLISDLQEERQKLVTLNRDLDIERARLDKQNKELSKELETLRKEKKMAVQQIRDELVREIADVEREIKDASSELKKKRSMENVIIAKRASHKARTRLNEALQKDEEDYDASDTDEIKVGDTIHMAEYDVTAQVTAIDRENGMIEAANGPIHFKVSELSVKRIETQTDKKTTKVKMYRPETRCPLELDLRGKRADEVEVLVDSYLNDAAMSNLKKVRIITGFGMGVVKSIVTDYLKRHPLVESFQDAEREEGGGGATNVVLK